MACLIFCPCFQCSCWKPCNVLHSEPTHILSMYVYTERKTVLFHRTHAHTTAPHWRWTVKNGLVDCSNISDLIRVLTALIFEWYRTTSFVGFIVYICTALYSGSAWSQHSSDGANKTQHICRPTQQDWFQQWRHQTPQSAREYFAACRRRDTAVRFCFSH